jgi:hypothetical protein
MVCCEPTAETRRGPGFKIKPGAPGLGTLIPVGIYQRQSETLLAVLEKFCQVVVLDVCKFSIEFLLKC